MTNKRFKHFFEYLGWTSVTIWIIGFFLFSFITIALKYFTLEDRQAIIVLTGGPDRISESVRLLKENRAPRLFISGVNKSVSPETILKGIEPELKDKIQLGYMADSTYTNALETSQWIKENQLNNIILVTSFYHMPRSLLEMHHRLPNLEMTPYSIFPRQFGESTHWIYTNYAWQLFLEYNKFLVTYFKYFIQRIML